MKAFTLSKGKGLAIYIKDHGYIYDRHSNHILKVSKEVLQDIENGNVIITNNDNPEYFQDFFPSSFSIDKIDNIDNKLNHALKNNLNHLILNVTEDCNIRCKYCIYSGKYEIPRKLNKGKAMNWTIAKIAVDYFIKNSIESEDKFISFYGGEPLLNYELIKKVIEYVRQVNPEIKFVVTTNSTLLNNDKIDFFVNNAVRITISNDGPKEIHDNSRVSSQLKGTYEFVEKRIKYINQNYPEYFEKSFSINCTLTPAVNLVDKLETYFNKKDFPSFRGGGKLSLGVVNPYENTYYKEVKYEQFIIDYFAYILSKFKDLHIKGIRSVDDLPPIYRSGFPYREITYFHFRENKKLDLYDYYWPNGICIPGLRSLFVSCDGDYFPCEKLYDLNKMKIGDIDNGISINTIKEHIDNYSKSKIEKCKNCFAYRFCGACFIVDPKNEILINENFSKGCNGLRNLWLDIIITYIEIIEENPTAFNYLQSSDKFSSINDAMNC